MDHEIYMQRCVQLALNGLGRVSPNPMVGAVIVHEGKVIGEGWHQRAGEPHAEVNAINSVVDQSLLSESVIYVSLEPCAHFGKTPPCSDLIVEKKIPKAVIGCRDPFSEVNGKGIEKLRNAGVEVIEDVLQEECLELNKRFFTFHQKKRPYVILKWAQSRDGFIDRLRSKNENGINWITSPETKSLVHLWRSQEDAILVGAQTLLTDNPSLTTREVHGKNPVRLVLNKDKDIPTSAAVFDDAAPTKLFTHTHGQPYANAAVFEIADKALEQVLFTCYDQDIQSLIVEGGAQLLQSFIDEALWDEARVLTGDVFFKEGLKAPQLQHTPAASQYFGKDLLSLYYR